MHDAYRTNNSDEVFRTLQSQRIIARQHKLNSKTNATKHGIRINEVLGEKYISVEKPSNDVSISALLAWEPTPPI